MKQKFKYTFWVLSEKNERLVMILLCEELEKCIDNLQKEFEQEIELFSLPLGDGFHRLVVNRKEYFLTKIQTDNLIYNFRKIKV